MIDFGINAQEENKELLQYYWFESAFSPAQCKEIIKIGKSHPQEGGQIFADNSEKEDTEKNETRNSTVRWIDHQDPRLSWLTDEKGRMTIEATKELFQ